MIKTGVFLARMQPLHNAHLYVMERACRENDKVIVILGSSNKVDMLRNPFNIELRTHMLKTAIADHMGWEHADKIEVYEIPDWSHEADEANKLEWGSYLYYNIVSRAKTKTFTIYYSDEPKIMLSWFNEDITARINFAFLERSNIFEGLSATKIRQAFEYGDIGYIRKYCPAVVQDRFKELQAIWFEVVRDPKADFSMT